jgi:hypothetical protein
MNMERNSFFCRNLEAITQDSWNCKAKKGTQRGMQNLVLVLAVTQLETIFDVMLAILALLCD